MFSLSLRACAVIRTIKTYSTNLFRSGERFRKQTKKAAAIEERLLSETHRAPAANAGGIILVQARLAPYLRAT